MWSGNKFLYFKKKHGVCRNCWNKEIKKLRLHDEYVYVILIYRQDRNDFEKRDMSYFLDVCKTMRSAVFSVKYKYGGDFKYCRKRKAYVSEFKNDYNLVEVFKIQKRVIYN